MALPIAQPKSANGLPRAQRPVTLAVIVGNRGFFPKHLVTSGRQTMLEVLEQAGIRALLLDETATAYGAVESYREAQVYGEFFRQHRDEIDGVLVTLPNFGDERAIANTLKLAGLNVPVLIHAFPDDVNRMGLDDRRDSFCGKMSVCNNLRQYNIPYTLTRLHTVDPTSESFLKDLQQFAAICRVVRGMRTARIGALGARPQAFNTVRFSEKLLQHAGITVETLDLSEAFGRIATMADSDPDVLAKRAAVERYARTAGVPDEALNKMAKLGVMIDRWMADAALDATAVQCWNSMQDYFGIVPCTIMSMMSNGLAPSACETDVAGTVAMLALALASGKPSALLDWNNNYGDDPDKAVVFHCSNLPKDVFVDEIPVMQYQEIIAGTVGAENAYGAIYARIRETPFTYLRVATDDLAGQITAYVGEGEFTDDPLNTFGGYGVVRVPHFQELLAYICENGYEHHVSVNQARVSGAIYEAFTKYLDWPTYYHR
ncbi:MAG: fucose isomerase [Chloroflexi bacterium]|nr:fucose isomerase [Chloroflexota bacterium]